MTRWVDRVKKPGDAFMQAAKKAQRREKKDIYAALQREQTEREAELANKYRDRAAERRAGKADDDGADLPGGFFGDSFKAAGDRLMVKISFQMFNILSRNFTDLIIRLDYELQIKHKSSIRTRPILTIKQKTTTD